MMRARHHLVLAAATGSLLLSAAPAQAAADEPREPVWSTSTFTLSEPVPFGPCPSVHISRLTVERREATFNTSHGDQARIVAFVTFTGTLTGANGQQIEYSGRFKVVEDVRRRVTTTTGRNARAVLPDGDVVLAAGRRVEDVGDLVARKVRTEAGANTFQEFNDEICAVLGG
jgi:hypothetical protein